jgi:hypothetical protein
MTGQVPAVEYCCCSSCRAFYRQRPFDGWQLRLFPRAAFENGSSGGQPVAAPLPDPDAPVLAGTDVSAPSSRSVETRARGMKPENAHV